MFLLAGTRALSASKGRRQRGERGNKAAAAEEHRLARPFVVAARTEIRYSGKRGVVILRRKSVL